ncbi:MAG TPA: TerC family protein, partial [Panacibacter sp.]|nr:TerC family protein [Panacibacter sp.]
MENLLTVDSLISLLTLTILEIVLGIDNVIFVAILIGRLDEVKQKLNARRIWMFAGIAVRIGLLVLLGWLVNNGSKELFGFSFNQTHYAFNLRNCIMFAG